MNNHYMHHIRGRVRVRIPALRENAKAAQEFQATMQQLPGVGSVEVDLLTGSVLVHYDGESSTAELVCGMLQRRGAWLGSNTAANTPPRRSIAGKIGRMAAKATANYFLDVAIERVVTATLVGLL